MGCKAASETYLKVLNGIVLVCSLVIIALSGYLTSELDDYKDALDTFPIIGPLVFGVFLFVLSIVGLIGVNKQNKCLLLLYIIVSTLITIIVLACGAALLSYTELLNDVEEGKNLDEEVQSRIVDVELAVYEKCCVEEFDLEPAEPCSDTNDDVCVEDVDDFEKVAENLNDEVCVTLEDIKVGGDPIVGPVADGGCGGGSPEKFVKALSSYLEGNLKALGIANLVLAIIMLLDIIAACVLLWSKKELKQKYLGFKVEEKGGPELATGENNDVVLTSQRYTKG